MTAPAQGLDPDELERLYAAATEGPWELRTIHADTHVGETHVVTVERYVRDGAGRRLLTIGGGPLPVKEADLAARVAKLLIASANALPALIAGCRELDAVKEKLEALTTERDFAKREHERMRREYEPTADEAHWDLVADGVDVDAFVARVRKKVSMAQRCAKAEKERDEAIAVLRAAKASDWHWRDQLDALLAKVDVGRVGASKEKP